MSVELAGAVAVVTGAGSGIGRGSAHAFAKRGARVVVTDIESDRAMTVADEIGDQAVGARCDVRETAELEVVRDLALERFGRIDVVMNNVGIPIHGAVEEIPVELWQLSFDVNVLGIVRSNLVFLPHLIEQGSGHVVNTGSMAGLVPFPAGTDEIPYVATKYAVVGMSETMAVDLRPKGIGVSCFCPAGVKTNIFEQVIFHGEPHIPEGPSFPLIEADAAGELIADAIEQDQFLILTLPEVANEMRDRGAGMDAYIDRVVETMRG
jgi:NAD(P)-dependent dehydrogenase (short-subunit alcohol dehydrogenase family)